MPVNFSSISRVSILCEIVAMHETLVPDVSLGTHFLNELVEMNMLYLALFPEQGDNYLSKEFFEKSPSKLVQLIASTEKWYAWYGTWKSHWCDVRCLRASGAADQKTRPLRSPRAPP